tara:strand:+ start:274 stop:1329 length:1056 start_codon:yes stop_codon:yes gene_type:complete
MDKYLVNKDISLKRALEALDNIHSKCLVVVGSKNKLLGTISDGDIRRAILKNPDLERPIDTIFNKKPLTFTKDDKENLNSETRKVLLKDRISLVPILSKAGEVVEVLTHDSIVDEPIKIKESINADVVIMSGGKGTRLKPFTDVLPKPLIPIQDKTILEHIIGQFLGYQISDFYLTLNFKSIIIKAFFEELDPEYKVNFLDEKEALGTASSLQLLPLDSKKHFFVTNCDTLIKVDLKDFYDFHINGDYDLSLIASAVKYNIPYGTCVLDKNGDLKEISEKPQFNFLVNSGMYLVNPNSLSLIPKNSHYDITDFMHDIIKNSGKVGVFPVKEDDWTDIGQWEEYKKVVKNFN